MSLDKPALHRLSLGMDESVRKYMAEIGRKGGKANKGKATEKCRLAARARWEKYRAQQERQATEGEEISAQQSPGDCE